MAVFSDAGGIDSRRERILRYKEEGLTKADAEQIIGGWNDYSVTHGMAGMTENRVAMPMFHAGVHMVSKLFEIGMPLVAVDSDSYRWMQIELHKHEQAMSSDAGISVSGQRLFLFVQACGATTSPPPPFARKGAHPACAGSAASGKRACCRTPRCGATACSSGSRPSWCASSRGGT